MNLWWALLFWHLNTFKPSFWQLLLFFFWKEMKRFKLNENHGRNIVKDSKIKFVLICNQVGQLAEVEDDTIAHVLSWHMLPDMDCVITKTTASAMRVHKSTNGRQQLLPIDSIYKKNPDWNRYATGWGLKSIDHVTCLHLIVFFVFVFVFSWEGVGDRYFLVPTVLATTLQLLILKSILILCLLNVLDPYLTWDVWRTTCPGVTQCLQDSFSSSLPMRKNVN